MDHPYTVVGFDVVGVLTASAHVALFQYEAELGYEPGALLRMWSEPLDDPAADPTWDRLERGEIEARQFWELLDAAASARGRPVSVSEVQERFVKVLSTPQEAMIELAREAREAGLRTAILTNNVSEYQRQWRQTVGADIGFDWAFDSCELGVRKPEAAFFERALAGMEIAPGELVFLDDSPENIDAAALLGISAILVDDLAEAASAARSLLNLPRSEPVAG